MGISRELYAGLPALCRSTLIYELRQRNLRP
jgi:hypothetical protein